MKNYWQLTVCLIEASIETNCQLPSALPRRKQTMDYFSNFTQSMTNLATDIGLKVLGALALWLIGSWLIRIAVKLTERAMKNQKVDKTIIGYVGSTMTIMLKIMLVISTL
jgi:small conductance mechanosensitive channel